MQTKKEELPGIRVTSKSQLKINQHVYVDYFNSGERRAGIIEEFFTNDVGEELIGIRSYTWPKCKGGDFRLHTGSDGFWLYRLEEVLSILKNPFVSERGSTASRKVYRFEELDMFLEENAFLSMTSK